MKKSDVRIGMKVTPLSKSIGATPLHRSYMWKQALEKKQKFLYVIRVGRYITLAEDKKSTHGDWFHPSDLVPYPQKVLSPVQMLKKLVNISSKALDADIELSEKDRNVVMDDLWSALREARSVIKKEKK